MYFFFIAILNGALHIKTIYLNPFIRSFQYLESLSYNIIVFENLSILCPNKIMITLFISKSYSKLKSSFKSIRWKCKMYSWILYCTEKVSF